MNELIALNCMRVFACVLVNKPIKIYAEKDTELISAK